jgi:hypothetical protein
MVCDAVCDVPCMMCVMGVCNRLGVNDVEERIIKGVKQWDKGWIL